MFSGLKEKTVLYINDRHEEFDTEWEDRNRLYDKRILALLEHNDIALFGEDIDSDLWNYYRSLQLATINVDNVYFVNAYNKYESLTKAALQERSLISQLKECCPDLVMPYIVSKDGQSFAEQINSQLLTTYTDVARISNKALYRAIMNEIGIPVIPGHQVDSLAGVCNAFCALSQQGYKRVVLRKERSVGGIGVFVIDNLKDCVSCYNTYCSTESSILVEACIEEVIVSPNVQYWITPTAIELIVISDQLFYADSFRHRGNQYPSKLVDDVTLHERVLFFGLEICRYLYQQRCYGLVGIDFIVSEKGLIYSTEINYRFNMSTYAALIVQKLFGNDHDLSWKTYMYHGEKCSFLDLYKKHARLFISESNRFGLFPIDISLLAKYGEAQLLVCGKNRDDVERICEVIEN